MYLRPVISSDLNDLFKIYGDPATNTFNPAGPYPNIDHAKMVMNRWLDHWQTHSFGNWAISPLTNPEKIIGFGGLGIRNYDEYVNLGRSGLKVSRLCLGCMSYGEPERLPQPWSLDEKASRPLIRQALEAGINFFDTANIYSGGSSEEITGKALREMARRDEIVVATKTFFPWRNSPNTGFLSRKAIFQSIDDSLMRLGMDYVDLFQIHRFDYSTPVEETMEALHDVVKAGKARYIGASSMEAWRFAKMQHTAERNGWTRFITMQPQYNLLYREEEREMLPLCEDQGVGVIPWSPMARGRLTRDWSVTSRRTQNDAFALKMYENAALLDKPVIDVVASIAEKHAVPRAHVAIAWLLSKSVITAPIIGATKPEHLSTAISALDFSLSDAEITELEARYLPHPVDGIIPPLPDTPPSLTPPSAIQNY
ncbi:GNAT family N-acetyltransferase [Klebsiella pneumoniae]|uniref:aldo/keto reductase n=1 Tax=Klebsiella pneumoniae TaxID=573 RepID=UPI0013DE1FB9|nr:aldo/keto reductase [Klebsiella pneumoniae]NGN24798.1 GNAT family N-acetyltransferase [Klebsiella pneumoniae]NGO01226.1 GNAT family N-acetyltransferase [Klebsiella pneumoniae]HBZ3970029.1 GNAT family N-acetyltransferase [Klebsiella pneumoniae]